MPDTPETVATPRRAAQVDQRMDREIAHALRFGLHTRSALRDTDQQALIAALTRRVAALELQIAALQRRD